MEEEERNFEAEHPFGDDNGVRLSGGFGGGYRGGGGWRAKKLDLPIFNGANPDGWIMRAERFFHFYRLTEEEKVEAAVVSLDGDALLWYQWEHRRRPIHRWEEIKALLLKEFRPSVTGTLYGQWMDLRQTGSVEEYRRKFIELIAPLEGITEEVALGKFISGLKEGVKNELWVTGPRNLELAMDQALRIDNKQKALGRNLSYSQNSWGTAKSYHPTSFSKPATPAQSNYSTYSTASNTLSPNKSSPNLIAKTLPIAKPLGELRRLSEKDLQYKREKGLCFRCDEKWHVGHKCKQKELSVLLTYEEEGEEEGIELADTTMEDPYPAHHNLVTYTSDTNPPNQPSPEISLNSVMGLTSPKTLKLEGSIKGEKVVVMIDPGATHNFISLETIQRLQLPVSPSKSFGVSLGTGAAVQGEGECKQVEVVMQGVVIMEDFLPLPLGNSDIILGIQWLEKLGTMTTNWKTQTLVFKGGTQWC